MKQLGLVIFLVSLFTTTALSQQHVGHYSFTDVDGKDVRLSDFSGKLIVIDLWYTGCGGCSYFYKNILAPIEHELAADTNIVFLSLSADKDREVWLASLRSGIYTGDHALNLNTGGKYFFHDMLVQQRVVSYPHFQLIDQSGHLVCQIRKPNRLSQQTIVELIHSYL